MEEVIEALKSALGADAVLTGDEIAERYKHDWRGETSCTPRALMRPRSTDDVATILRICHEHGQPVVPQSGMTGLCGGATPRAEDVALSLERMSGVEEIDAAASTLTALAGTPLQTIQEAAQAAGFLCALDLGARGSCLIGGNVSTNAGGNRVLRYGMARDLVLGIEVECRLANAVFRHANRGWHVTGAVGSLGAAAACAKALALEEQQIAFALGTAATQVVGLREMFGSMCKSLHTGRAADNGLTAAMLAAEGYTSADAAVEGPQGYAQVLNGATDLAGVVGALGQRYEISRLSYKPYACGVVMHPTIEACLRAREARPDLSARATAITLRVHPDVLSATGKQSPRTGLETKFSVYHAAAVALVHGIAGEDAFSDAMAVDPHVSAVRGRVRAQPDEAVRKDEVHATFSLPGETIEEHIDHVVGSVTRPMTDADLERKFESLAGEVLGASRCGRLLERCRGFEEISDAREVLAAATA